MSNRTCGELLTDDTGTYACNKAWGTEHSHHDKPANEQGDEVVEHDDE